MTSVKDYQSFISTGFSVWILSNFSWSCWFSVTMSSAWSLSLSISIWKKICVYTFMKIGTSKCSIIWYGMLLCYKTHFYPNLPDISWWSFLSPPICHHRPETGVTGTLYLSEVMSNSRLKTFHYSIYYLFLIKINPVKFALMCRSSVYFSGFSSSFFQPKIY